MATFAKVGGEKKDWPIVPAGTHVARVYKFMNLGSRVQEYQGVMKDYPDTLINIGFELPNELNKYKITVDGVEEEVEKPFAISREFTLSMSPKSNLRPIVEGIIGTTLIDSEAKAFDLESLVGMPCLVTIVHKKSADGTKTYANLTSTSPLMKGMECPPAVNPPVVQNVQTMTLEEIEALPDFLATKIKDSDEFKDRFDPETLTRRADIQKNLNEKQAERAEEAEYRGITPEDIPF